MKPMRQFSTRDVVDFIVIGAGAAGGVVASELAKAGFQTVVLGRGPGFSRRTLRTTKSR